MKTNYLLIALSIIFYNCGSVHITSDSLVQFDIADYKTYNYFTIDYSHYDSLPYNKSNISYLKNEIDHALKKIGLSVSEKPDLLLNIGVVVQQRTQTRETDPRYDMNYAGQRNYHWEREDLIVGYYDEGALTIDLVDTKMNALIWQGTAIGILSNNEKKIRQRIDDAVDKLFLDLSK
jgi:hypothetical protein